MSLEKAILGFLSYQPMTGYDLKKLFDGSVRHFWYADQSQIYRTLAKLAEEGMATIEVINQNDKPDRKVYHITPAGLTDLRTWLSSPFPVEQAHSGPLVQVFFSGKLSDQEVLQRMEKVADLFKEILKRYEMVPQVVEEYIKLVGSQREAYFWMCTLDLGIETMKTQLAWAEKIIADLKLNRVPEQ